MTLIVLRNTIPVFCRMSLTWDAFDVYLRDRLRLCILGEKTTEVKCHFQHIISRVHTMKLVTVVVDLSRLAKTM